MEMKKTYRSIGWKYAVFALVVYAVQFLMVWLLPEEITEAVWFTWGTTVVSIYVIGYPVLLLLTRNNEVTVPEKHSLTFGSFLICVLIGAGICGVGSIVGTIVDFVLLLPAGPKASQTQPLIDMMLHSSPIYPIVVAGILAPIFEELLFRKLFIDRTVKYGEWMAILVSGLMFGLFHGNFSQFFFATGLGIFWGYIYVRTGKIIYTILFHMVVNLNSSVITLQLYKRMPMDKVMELSTMSSELLETERGMELFKEVLPSMLLYYAWCGVLGLCALIGLVLYFCNRKKFFLKHAEGELVGAEAGKAAMLNLGILLFFLIAVVMFVLYYVERYIG